MTDHDDHVIGPTRRRSPAPDELRAARLHHDARLAAELYGARPEDRRHRMFSAVLRDFLFGVLVRMEARGTLYGRIVEPGADAHSSERIAHDVLRLATAEAVDVFMAERLTTGTWSAAEGMTIQEDVVAHGLRALAAQHRSKDDPTRPASAEAPSSPLVESVLEVLASTEPTVVALAVLRAAGVGLESTAEALGMALPVVDNALQRFWNRIATTLPGEPGPPSSWRRRI